MLANQVHVDHVVLCTALWIYMCHVFSDLHLVTTSQRVLTLVLMRRRDIRVIEEVTM